MSYIKFRHCYGMQIPKPATFVESPYDGWTPAALREEEARLLLELECHEIADREQEEGS